MSFSRIWVNCGAGAPRFLKGYPGDVIDPITADFLHRQRSCPSGQDGDEAGPPERTISCNSPSGTTSAPGAGSPRHKMPSVRKTKAKASSATLPSGTICCVQAMKMTGRWQVISRRSSTAADATHARAYQASRKLNDSAFIKLLLIDTVKRL